MAIKYDHIDGKDKGDVKLYALSTCIWCKKTKNLLSELDVGYDYVDVDMLDDDERKEAVDQVKKFNQGGGFPTMVINDSDHITGFDEAKIKEVFE